MALYLYQQGNRPPTVHIREDLPRECVDQSNHLARWHYGKQTPPHQPVRKKSRSPTVPRREQKKIADIFKDQNISVRPWAELHSLITESDLIVNTTNQGMAGQTPLDLSLELAQPKAIVADIIYVPLKTSLIKDAKSRGLRTVGGLGMLLHKSRPAWKLWFGIDPEITESLCSIMEKKYQRERLISPASRPQ